MLSGYERREQVLRSLHGLRSRESRKSKIRVRSRTRSGRLCVSTTSCIGTRTSEPRPPDYTNIVRSTSEEYKYICIIQFFKLGYILEKINWLDYVIIT